MGYRKANSKSLALSCRIFCKKYGVARTEDRLQNRHKANPLSPGRFCHKKQFVSCHSLSICFFLTSDHRNDSALIIHRLPMFTAGWRKPWDLIGIKDMVFFHVKKIPILLKSVKCIIRACRSLNFHVYDIFTHSGRRRPSFFMLSLWVERVWSELLSWRVMTGTTSVALWCPARRLMH